ncbi:Lrp/AsnC family transcriptional regulator [Maritimibacter fusiformis]|uniref:Lrp/AsnC family transcriptional regulator n=1 Tax=Maritimibacter fusiformis TaxID=2603819 RepID=A0A5D0RIE3_9RHOB|nr:Lrp/AsnC family transcriptional regulator [Maritimibacter fusiformis]TYB81367.1 Lrp/AsnC family transcriptional regulator [Maritimibacter fusiformis]
MSKDHPPLDETDKRLLSILQRDGRISVQDLAAQAGLSTSPCWRRLRKLEQSGLIAGYAALIDPRRIGLSARAYVHVSLIDHGEDTIRRFDAFVAQDDQIVECASATGTDDYILKVVARDAEGLERFLMQRLLGLGLVRSSTTHFVLREKKRTTALPLDLD